MSTIRVLALGVWLAIPATALADLPGAGRRPRPLPPLPPNGNQAVPFIVEVDEKAEVARLLIPRNLVAARADAGAIDENTGLAWGTSPGRLVMAGLALSASLGLGGWWLSRRGGGRGLVAGLVGVSLLGMGAALAWANGAPLPIPARPLPAVPLATGKVQVEVIDKGEAIVLIVNKGMLTPPAQPPIAVPLPGAPAIPPPAIPDAPPPGAGAAPPP